MQENINVAVNVSDNGTTDKANKNAEQLRATLKGAAEAAASVRIPTATAAARQGVAASQPVSAAYRAATGPAGGASDTNLSRGVAGQTGASGRDFAAQAQGLGGLVHVYATFAANLYAVSAAFGALSKAMDLSNMVKGLDQLGASSGRSLGGLAKQMVSVADGAISMRDAMNSTALASAGGLSNANILRMTEVAKKASLALGRDLPDSMDRLTKGIVKTQPELLDELGIMARVIPAQQEYARQLGKSASSLSEFEKKQAFANAVLAEGERKFGAIELDANPYSKILSSMSNLMQIGLELINKVLSPVLTLLSTSPTALSAAMAGIATILLKQAIPAFGMFREQAKRAQEETKARLEKQVSEQQYAAAETDAIIGRSAENQFKKSKEAQDKIASLQNQRFSSKVVGKEVRGILSMNPLDISEDQRKAVLDKHKELESKVNSNAATAAELAAHKKLTSRLASEAELNKAVSDAGDVARANAEAQDQKWYSHQELRSKQLRSMRQAEAKAGVLAGAADNAAVMGPTYAFQKLREETGKLDAGKVSKAFTLIQGGALIATSAISNLINVYGVWAMAAGIVYGALDSYFTKNAKEMEALAQSSSLLDSALDNVNSTIKAILANKDPLYYISVEALSARANALQTVVEQMAAYGQKTKEAIQAQQGWDKSKNWIKGLFGESVQDDAAKALAKSISSAFKIATEGPERAKAAEEIKKLFNISIDPSSFAALQTALNADNYEQFYEKAHAIAGKMSHDISNTASEVQKLNDDFNSASKAFDAVIMGMLPTDNVAKLGFELIKTAQGFDKALEKPANAISEMAKLSGDMSRLKLINPEFATILIEGSSELKGAAEKYSKLTKEVDQANKKQFELQGEIDAIYAKKKGKGAFGADASLVPVEKRAVAEKLAEKEALGKESARKAGELKQIETTFKPLLKQFSDQQYEMLSRGANLVSVSLENSLDKGAIALSKVYAEGLAGTKEGVRINAELDKKSIQIDIDQLKASLSLITVTDNLRIVQEKVLLESMKGRLNTVDLEDKPELEAAIKLLNQDIKVQEKLRNADSKTLAAILNKGAPGVKIPTDAYIAEKAAGAAGDPGAASRAAHKVGGGAFLGGGGVGTTEIASTQATQEAARKLLAAAQNKEATLNAIKLEQQKQEGVEAHKILADRAIDYQVKKDMLEVDIVALGIAKAGLDVQSKSAVFVNESLLNSQIANENAKARLEYLKSDLDFAKRIEDANGNAKAIVEINEARRRNTAKYDATVSAKNIADEEKRSTSIKNQKDFLQKILDIRTAISNLKDNTDLTIQENALNLEKELGILNSERLAEREDILAVRKEEIRSEEALRAIESARNLENNDYDKRKKDLKAGDAEALSNLNKLHDATLDKLMAQEAAERKINEDKLVNLDIQKQSNIANGKIADKLKLLEHEKALSQDIFDINQRRIDLDDQMLEKAKQLNLVSIEYYNAKKADLAITKARAQYDSDMKTVANELLIAEERLTKARRDREIIRRSEAANAVTQNDPRMKDIEYVNSFTPIVEGAALPGKTIAVKKPSTEKSQAEIDAEKSIELLRSKANSLGINLKLYEITTAEQQDLNDKTQIQNRLLKEQSNILQMMESRNSVKLLQLDLDKQRLDNAKALNKISEETFINETGRINLEKLDLQYQKDKQAAADDVTNALKAQADLAKQAKEARPAIDNTEKAGGAAGYLPAIIAPDPQVIADSAKLVADTKERAVNIDVAYTKNKLITDETVKQSQQLEIQNRLLKSYESLAQSLTTLFDEVGTAMGETVNALTAAGKAQKDLNDQKQEEMDILARKYEDTPERDIEGQRAFIKEKAALEQKYAKRSTEEALLGIATTAKANKKMFDEKSAGYKVLSGLEKASSLMTMAMKAKELAASIASDGLLIASKIPAIFASFMASMGPFGIPAAAAAIAAFIGVATQGSSAKSTPQTYDEFKTSKGNATGVGGVAGDSSAINEGLKNTLENLLDIAKPELALTSQMASSLRVIANNSVILKNSIDRGALTARSMSLKNETVGTEAKDLGGAALGGTLLGGGFATSGLIAASGLVESGLAYIAGAAFEMGGSAVVIGEALGTAAGVIGLETATLATYLGELGSIVPGLGTAIGVLAGVLIGSIPEVKNFLFGEDTLSQSLVGFGTVIDDQTLAVASSNIQMQRYDDVLTTLTHNQGAFEQFGNWLTGGDTSDQTTTSTQRIQSSLRTPEELAFAKQIQGVYAGIKSTLLVASNALGVDASQLGNFRTALNQVDLSSGTAEEKLARLTGAIGKNADAFAKQLLPSIDEFTHSGDTAFQAYVKLASAQEQVGQITDALGIKSITYSQIINKQGDYAAEMLRQSISQAEAGSGIAKIIDNFSGSAGDMVNVFIRLKDVRTSFTALGYSGELVNAQLLKGAGGLDNLTNALSTYEDKFLSSQDRLKISAAKLSESWKPLNAELKSMGLNIPQTKADFKKLVEALESGGASSSEMLGKVLLLADGMDKVSSASAEYLTKSLSQIQKMYEIQGRSDMAKAISRQQELNALDANLRPMQEYLYALEDEATLKGKLQASYDKLKTSLTNTIASLKTSIDNLKSYQTSLQLGANSTLTPQQAYAAAQSQLSNIATAAQQKLGTNATAQDIAARDKAVQALPGAIDAFLAQSKTSFASGAQYQADFAAVDAILNATTTELDNQKTNAELQLTAAESSANYLSLIVTSSQTTADLLTEYLNAQTAYNTGTARTDSAKPANLSSNISSALTSIGGINTAGVTTLPDSRGFAKPYADGGIASGLSIVGEEGPELADFRNPARIYTASQTNMLGDNAALVSELKALRDEVAKLRQEQKEQTGQIIISNYDANKRNADVVASTTESVAKMQEWKERSKVVIS